MPNTQGAVLLSRPENAAALPPLIDWLYRGTDGAPHPRLLAGGDNPDCQWVQMWSDEPALLVVRASIIEAILSDPSCRIDVPVEWCSFGNGLRHDWSVLRLNGEKHAGIRQVMDEILGRTNTDRLGLLRNYARDLAASLRDRETVDLVDYVEAVMRFAMMLEMDLSHEDWEQAVFQGVNPGQDILVAGNSNLLMARAWEHIEGFSDRIVDLVLSRPQPAPGYPVTDTIWELHQRGYGAEAISANIATYVSGYGSNVAPAVMALVQFATNPHLWRQFRAHKELRMRIIRELFRLRAHYALLNSRVLDKSLKLPGGTIIPAGVPLVPSMSGANTSAELFPNPLDFDPYRPPSHFSFGGRMVRGAVANPHACPAMPLGYAETLVALGALADAVGDMEPTGEITFGQPNLCPMPDGGLPVRFTA